MNRKTIDMILQSVGLESIKETQKTTPKWNHLLNNKGGVSVDGEGRTDYSSHLGLNKKG